LLVLKNIFFIVTLKMYFFRPLLIALFCIFAFTPGCSLRPEGRPPRALSSDNTPRIDLNNTPLVKEALYQQFKQWQGTPYRLGGLDQNGIDCSGLVYLTFRTRFGILLPRSTEELLEVGRDVTRERLQPGDLLFFSTGFFDRHVGIYLGNRKFLHASKNRGVISSHLDDDYWYSHFQKAKRIRNG
jgi:probable lipoprotein NlpC